MSYSQFSEAEISPTSLSQPARAPQRYLLHLGLFIATFISCILAGMFWHGETETLDLSHWTTGLSYAVLIMLFISAHEFGHYFAARFHGVDASLPFYIPMPFPSIMPFGTMGAVIRTRSPIQSRKVLFDIGVSGPLAGFVVCVIILIIGFINLPTKDYIYQIHPEYLTYLGGEIPGQGLFFGDTLLYTVLAKIFANPNGFLPPMNEMYHYPFLCVGWFGMFVTALNLLPIGQLDGGHVTYALFGRKQGIIARVVVGVLVFIGFFAVLGYLRSILLQDSADPIFNGIQSVLKPTLDWVASVFPWAFDGWMGWLFWAVLARFLFRMDHPPIEDETPLDLKRRIIGWCALVVFVLTISLNGISDHGSIELPGSGTNSKVVVQLSHEGAH